MDRTASEKSLKAFLTVGLVVSAAGMLLKRDWLGFIYVSILGTMMLLPTTRFRWDTALRVALLAVLGVLTVLQFTR
jgi:hypothetical protein